MLDMYFLFGYVEVYIMSGLARVRLSEDDCSLGRALSTGLRHDWEGTFLNMDHTVTFGVWVIALKRDHGPLVSGKGLSTKMEPDARALEEDFYFKRDWCAPCSDPSNGLKRWCAD